MKCHNHNKYLELENKCKTCLLGCGRLEDENFKGVYRCEYYIEGVKTYDNNKNSIINSKQKK